MYVTGSADQCMICKLFRSAFQHNFSTQYRLDQHCNGSISAGALAGAYRVLDARAVTSRDLLCADWMV